MKPNITLPLSRILKSLLALSLSLGVGSTFGAASIAVTVAASTGSAGKTYGSKIEKTVLYTPCVVAKTPFGADPTKPTVTVDPATASVRDAFTISISIANEVDSTSAVVPKPYKWTPYVFVVNTMGDPAATDITAQIFAIEKLTSLFVGNINS
ncbi:MAG: hypothetical protein WCP34_14335, partial [Pseudomonadota bacterium]